MIGAGGTELEEGHPIGSSVKATHKVRVEWA